MIPSNTYAAVVVRVILICLICGQLVVAQSNPAVVVSAGYQGPGYVTLAPGQLITIYVAGIDLTLEHTVRASALPLPTSLAGFSVQLGRGSEAVAIPILAVSQWNLCLPADPGCGTLTALTVQVPYEFLADCDCCLGLTSPLPAANFTVFQNGVPRGSFQTFRASSRIHVVNSCDSVLAGTGSGIQCRQAITHADGTLVDYARPAKAREQIVVYALGLGAVVGTAKSGDASPLPALRTGQALLLGFDFSVNAPAKPAPDACISPAPGGSLVFAGLTPGFVGLYQVNLIVPNVPKGLPACGPSVQSNLTVTLSSPASYDGVSLCVETGS